MFPFINSLPQIEPTGLVSVGPHIKSIVCHLVVKPGHYHTRLNLEWSSVYMFVVLLLVSIHQWWIIYHWNMLNLSLSSVTCCGFVSNWRDEAVRLAIAGCSVDIFIGRCYFTMLHVYVDNDDEDDDDDKAEDENADVIIIVVFLFCWW